MASPNFGRLDQSSSRKLFYDSYQLLIRKQLDGPQTLNKMCLAVSWKAGALPCLLHYGSLRSLAQEGCTIED